MINRPIVLIGMMGSGKSALGAALAKKLNLPFVDADAEIEKQEGAKISAIFAEHGEPRFRKIEENVLRKLLDGKPAVIAAGGGAIVSKDTRRILFENALTVWLKADIPVLLARTGKDTSRPLLNVADPQAALEKLLCDRRTHYGKAQIHIDTGKGTFDETVDELLAKVQDAPT